MKNENTKKSEVPNTDDKYKDKPIKFVENKTHYDLFYFDNFQFPDKDYTVLADVVMDLKNADKSKELHIWICSYGGFIINLISLIQQINEFDHIVTICNGSAMSCGFLLWCLGHERYVSPISDLLYHAISTGAYGKGFEILSVGKFVERHTDILVRMVGADKVLSREEIKIGETTEVWFLGEDFIKRGVAKDFSEYKNRVIPTKVEVTMHKDKIYFKENGKYIQYEKKSNEGVSYVDIIK